MAIENVQTDRQMEYQRKTEPTYEELTEDQVAQLEKLIAEYAGQRGALIPVLQKAQGIVGYLPHNVQIMVGEGLNINPSEVYGVATFYAFFSLIPRGRHICKVCLGTACYVKGGEKIIKQLERDLDVEEGLTTEDRRFTLEAVRCVGACSLAPVIVIDDVDFEQIDSITELPDIIKRYE
jgi:NADH:ubiquinone oxidoreductase subunit E